MRKVQVVQWGLFLCLLFMSTGCQGVDVFASSPMEPAGQVGEVPYDYDAMREDVVIQLREEPRLQSPTRTVVGEGPQTYTLFFREAMDRNSVEAAIRLHAKETANQQGYVEPDWDFHWVNDRQLHLVANLDTSPVPGQGGIEYLIHVAGAKTLEGRELPGETPAFGAVWFAPQQLWKISMDGQVRQQLTDFPVLFGMTLIDPDSRYLLLSRYQEYCECDIRYPKLYGVYDLQEGTLTHYPVDLVREYRGEGDFVADRRGFFYARPDEGVAVPKSDWASRVQIDGFVHGASFSRDHRYLFMAVGRHEQQRDLDLLLYDLEAGQVIKRLPGVVQGTVPISELYDTPVPISFTDDGRQVTFAMRESDDSLSEKRWRYDWETGGVTVWEPPVEKDAWSGYDASDDGMYQLYWNGGLFRGDVFLGEWPERGVWIPGSHQFAYAKSEPNGFPTKTLYVYDADRREERALAAGMPESLRVIGSSQDGKWLYVQTEHDLPQ